MDNGISQRLLSFGSEIIKLSVHLNKSVSSRYVSGQLIRAGTSAGANYEEACGAESKADFIHKIQIVLKEIRETVYWLRLIKKSGLISNSNLEVLTKEAEELTNIIAKSVITAKKK